MFKKGVVAIVVFIWLIAGVFAQEVKPVGLFQEDSIKIGENLPYSLSIKYPKNMDVVFPDSLHDYSPFEYQSRTYFPTKSDSVYSYDSVVYYLATFEVDSIQYLRLPILLRNRTDSSQILPSIDSVYLTHVVEAIPDSISMIDNTAFLNTPSQFNYPYYIIALIILGVIALIILLVFGKSIRRKFILRRMSKKYQKFIAEFDNLVIRIKQENSIQSKEHLVVFWKKYLEKLEKKPYTKLTSKEVIKLNMDNKLLKGALQNIDKAIYGNIGDSQIDESYSTLKTTATQKYQAMVKEINTNG